MTVDGFGLACGWHISKCQSDRGLKGGKWGNRELSQKFGNELYWHAFMKTYVTDANLTVNVILFLCLECFFYYLQKTWSFISISLLSCARCSAPHPCSVKPRSCPSAWPDTKRCLNDPMSLASNWMTCRLWWHSTPPILSTSPILNLSCSVCLACWSLNLDHQLYWR